jgi:hypothetical protein
VDGGSPELQLDEVVGVGDISPEAMDIGGEEGHVSLKVAVRMRITLSVAGL